jgi:hypothetical protein
MKIEIFLNPPINFSSSANDNGLYNLSAGLQFMISNYLITTQIETNK